MSEVETGGTPETEQAKGLDAILEGAIEQHEAPDTPAVEAEPVSEDAGRARDATGKFVAKDKPEATASDKGQAEVTDKTPTPTVSDTAVAQQVAIPEAWSPEWKAKIATLPPEQQMLVVDQYKAMQGDYTVKSQKLAEQRKAYEPLLSEADKWTGYFQRIGMSPDQAFSALVQAEYTLRTGQPHEKQAMLAKLASDYGIYPQTGQVQADPAYSQLHQELSGLKSQLQTFQQLQEQSEQQKLKSEIDAFSQSKDPNGQLLRPHFERVRETMGKLIDSGQAETLDVAYAKAVRLDDELFKQTVEAERKRASDEAEKARVEAVEKAKKAQPTRSSDSGPKGAIERKGLEAHLDAAMEGMGLT